MPYRNSRYASANYIKATKPSKENMVQHYDSHEFSIPSNQALYIPFINPQPRDTQDDVQDDVKNTDKILGSSVEVGSRGKLPIHETTYYPYCDHSTRVLYCCSFHLW